MVLPDNKPFETRQDYDSQKINLGTVSINDKPVESEFKSNYFANQFDRIAKPGEKLTVKIKVGNQSKKIRSKCIFDF